MIGGYDPFSGLLLMSAAFAAIYGAVCAGSAPSWPKTIVKVLAIAPLALVGSLIGVPVAIVLGLGLGALGDAFLSRPGERPFLAGMAAFAAAHLAYLAAILPVGAGFSLLAAVPILGFALSTEWWLQPRAGRLRWPVRAYVVVIAAMATAAFSLGPGHLVLQFGVALLLLSGLLFAVQRFVLADRPEGSVLPRALWVSYWAGQVLILLGATLIS